MCQSSHRRFSAVLIAALLLGLSLALPAPAVRAGLVRWVVPTTDGPMLQTECLSILNFCSLREALAAAADGDTIQFHPQTTGTIVLDATQGALPVTHAVTIAGPGAGTLAVDGGKAVTVFTVNTGVTATIGGLTIQHGTGTDGGGIDNLGTLTVTNSTLTSNSSGTGGGIYNNRGTLTVTSSTFTGNTAGGAGGGIFNAGTLTVTNSTLSGNTANAGAGGGILNQGTAMVTNSTLTGNSSGNFGGGILNVGRATLTNALVANNPTGGDLNGTFTGSHNLVDDAANAGDFINGMNGNLVGHPALLGPLATYGGPTQTVPLLPGSPAIDQGSCATGYHDQRGIATVGAACDIGAFERQGFLLGLAGGTPQSTAVDTAFAQPLVVIVASAHGEPVQGGQVTFTAPTSGASATLMANPATIDSGGVASVAATANGTAGAYGVTASAAGASSATFALANTPILTTVSPASGATAGGNTVTLTGLGFGTSAANVAVTIGGVAAPVGSVTNTQVVVTAPAHAAVSVTVGVTVNGQGTTAVSGYTYGTVSALPNPPPAGGMGGNTNPLPNGRTPGAPPAGTAPSPLPAPRP